MANLTKYVSKPLEASYPYLINPDTRFDANKGKYTVTVLINKEDEEEVNKIKAAYESAITEGISKKFGGKAPNRATLRPVLKDGDDYDRAEFKGKWLLTCSSSNKPQVVDINLNPITEPKAIVGGDLIRVSVNFAAYNVGGSKGVSCYLGSVQLVKKTDTPFGSRSTPEADFGSNNDTLL